MTVVDPENKLSRIDWRTRERFYRMAAAFTEATGLALKVRSGLRTCAEQYDLYGIGRRYHLGAKPVTYAPGCRSWHVLGRAVDADPVDPRTGERRGDCSLYTAAGEVWEQLGGVWGGRWTAFGRCGDAGHFEYHPGLTTKRACPDPDACEQVQVAIATRAPFSWGAVALGAAVLGIGALAGYGLLESA